MGKNKFTYHRRLFTGLVVYSWLLVGCFAAFQYHREKEFKADELNAQLQLINERILYDMAEDGGVFDPKSINPHPFDELRVSIIGEDGRIIYDNSIDSLPDNNHLDRKEIAAAMKNGEGFAVRRHSQSTGQTYFYSAKTGDGYIVRTAVPYTNPLLAFLEADYGFVWFMIGVTALMCVIGYFVTRRVGINISRLRLFAERAERGERIYDTEPFPHDELGDISNHIVRLYARLQQAITDRDREHRSALHEEQEKIRIKKQLTNNINHELKTPVAAMQVCLETLIDHPDLPAAKREEFIRRCYDNNQRLRRLLADVSLITRMEDGGNVITREPVALDEIIADVCDDAEPAAEAKGMKIINNVEEGIGIRGNTGLLMSVFRNLLDNAIAYSGGRTVEIKSRRGADGRVTVTVADDGRGVGESDLPKLFERFYRVDDGRSRQSGGTGLGLSIVKNAVLWHGGDVSVANRREGGLEVTVRLPLDSASA